MTGINDCTQPTAHLPADRGDGATMARRPRPRHRRQTGPL